MERRVDPHGPGKLEAIGDWINLPHNLEGPHKPWS